MGLLFALFHHCVITLIKRQNVSPMPARHQVEFVAYGPELVGISLMIPTAPTLLAYGLVVAFLGESEECVSNTEGLGCPL